VLRSFSTKFIQLTQRYLAQATYETTSMCAQKPMSSPNVIYLFLIAKYEQTAGFTIPKRTQNLQVRVFGGYRNSRQSAMSPYQYQYTTPLCPYLVSKICQLIFKTVNFYNNLDLTGLFLLTYIKFLFLVLFLIFSVFAST